MFCGSRGASLFLGTPQPLGEGTHWVFEEMTLWDDGCQSCVGADIGAGLNARPALCSPAGSAPQKYSHLDQSLFTRFIRLGTPYIELNAQVGRGAEQRGPCTADWRAALAEHVGWAVQGLRLWLAVPGCRIAESKSSLQAWRWARRTAAA